MPGSRRAPSREIGRYRELYDSVVRPFVFRRYLDFGVFESLRAMKAMIAREVERRELQDNIKLGPGGIREIEFIVQAQQLIRGGTEPRLQEPSLLAVLPRLEGAKLMPRTAVAELRVAYEFLRRVENRLQMVDDAQTHALPVDVAGRERLASSMGYADPAQFRDALEAMRRAVTAQFDGAFLGRGGMAEATPAAQFEALWTAEPSLERIAEEATEVWLGRS